MTDAKVGKFAELRSAVASMRNVPASQVELEEISATDARKEFARMLETVTRRGLVVIDKQSAPKAVLLSFDDFRTLVQRRPRSLDTLSAEFDELLARMQKPAARTGMRAAFDATPAALGTAALSGAKARRKRG
jgi:antitoxin Phd